MAHIIKRNNAKIVLRNPAEKAKRYARQLKTGRVAETGKKLSVEDRCYRGGYLDARKDNARAYNHLWGKKNRRKKK